VPRYEDLDWTELNYPEEDFRKIMYIDSELWKQELLLHEELFSTIYDRLPKEFFFVRGLLLSALWRSPEKWGLMPETE
jgi:phosphoenolpyruvate carboxykinase (GTP)